MSSSLPKRQIKLIKALKESKNAREKNHCFVAEGLRSVEEIVKTDYTIEFTVVSEKFANKDCDRVRKLIEKLQNFKLYMISEGIYDTISDTVTPQGIMAVVRMKDYDLMEYADNNFLFVALDRIKDPGNMGTIIRTADAAGVNAVIAGKGCVDAYNPKVIRSTMGSIFHLPVIQTDDLIMTLKELKRRGGRIVTSHLKAKKYYYDVNLKVSTVLVMGKEDEGVSDEIIDISDEMVKIPMPGLAESLNVSIANGIILFEAVKQRMNKIENMPFCL
ncbi:MAG TPA: RNA methyltransferase [Thermoanaerobacterales bacterium]|nr:RNA methyltransferase [Thermoanaerobacterales bacterium]